ncbi:DUF1573 domain-containing protein [Bacteroidota bacterium]
MRIVGFFALLVIGALFACDGNNKTGTSEERVQGNDDNVKAEILFDTLVYDLGTITEGEQVIAWFDYTNSGNAPLVIKDIKAGCGCTVPEFSRLPLESGEKKTIKVVFNSRGKAGVQKIGIVVNSNAQVPTVELQLKGIVKRIY